MNRPSSSPSTRLIRLGFHEIARARTILGEPWFAEVAGEDDGDALLGAVGTTADPDLALLMLSHLLCVDGCPAEVTEALVSDGARRRRHRRFC